MDFGALRQTSAGEYALRFALGGLATVGTGLIAQHFGPLIGGVFLAFPAILPVSVSPITQHETRKKLRTGIRCSRRGRKAAGLDAAGASLGAVALIGFAITTWKMLATVSTALALSCALLVWSARSGLLWWLSKHRAPLRRWLIRRC